KLERDLDGKPYLAADENATLWGDQFVAHGAVRLIGAQTQLPLPPVTAPHSGVENRASAKRSTNQRSSRSRQRRSLQRGRPISVLGIDPERHPGSDGLAMPVQDGPVDVEQPTRSRIAQRRIARHVPLAEVAAGTRNNGRLGKPLRLVEVPQLIVARQRRPRPEDDRYSFGSTFGLDGPLE